MSSFEWFMILLIVLILPITLSAESVAIDFHRVAKQVLEWLEKEKTEDK